jgi:hypothetical protein
MFPDPFEHHEALPHQSVNATAVSADHSAQHGKGHRGANRETKTDQQLYTRVQRPIDLLHADLKSEHLSCLDENTE